MKYMGSKSRIIKDILPIIEAKIKNNNLKGFADLFVGGANVIDKIQGIKRIGADKNPYLIALYNNIDKVEQLPDIIEKSEYDKVRNSYHSKDNKYPDWYIGAVGFLSSYNGRFFEGGYSGIRKVKAGNIRNYYLESKNSLLKQMEKLQNVEWKCGDYRETGSNLEDWLIYCDPPYYNTKDYNTNFNHKDFWEWVKQMSEKNIVLVSEASCPDDSFECIWEKPIQRSIDNRQKKDCVEKLFEYYENIDL